MPCFICVTCGTQHAESAQPAERCAICEDPRQYVGWEGQRWTTLERVREGHHARIGDEFGLTALAIEPRFGIGQRALLVPSAHGNVLWDCITLLDDEIEAALRGAGGVAAIAISHPHYYSSMVEYSHAFDAPIYLHAADREWIMRPDEQIHLWEADSLELSPGLTLIRAGGHYEGGTVLHWADGCDGRGALLSGDVVAVVADRRWVSFMRSYPNDIPLPAGLVERIIECLEPYEFERVYGAFAGRVVARDGKAAVRRSAERYVRALGGDFSG